MGHQRGAAMQLGDGSQVYGKCQLHLLALAQAQTRGANEYARGTQVDGLTQRAAPVRHDDVHDGARTMSGVKTSFHDAPLGTPCELRHIMHGLGALPTGSELNPALLIVAVRE
jgi:hypothetical protein